MISYQSGIILGPNAEGCFIFSMYTPCWVCFSSTSEFRFLQWLWMSDGKSLLYLFIMTVQHTTYVRIPAPWSYDYFIFSPPAGHSSTHNNHFMEPGSLVNHRQVLICVIILCWISCWWDVDHKSYSLYFEDCNHLCSYLVGGKLSENFNGKSVAF